MGVDSEPSAGQHALRVHVLASGSKGNACVIENAATGEGILIDCGICKRDFLARCEEAGFDPARLSAILVTHDHTDHTKGLGVVLRALAKQGIHLPLYVSPAVVAASRDVQAVEDLVEIRPLAAEDQVSAGGMQAFAFRTSHDAAESFGFRVWDGDDAIGYMTDTGIVTGAAHEALGGVRLLALEANHDVRMLETGPYPAALKRRVASDLGHLSNDQAATELERLISDRLETVCAMHISENNNTYRLAQDALHAVVDRSGAQTTVTCGFQHRLTSL